MIGGVHLLPVYPSSGDGGFAPLKYDEVDPKFGDWDGARSPQILSLPQASPIAECGTYAAPQQVVSSTSYPYHAGFCLCFLLSAK